MLRYSSSRREFLRQAVAAAAGLPWAGVARARRAEAKNDEPRVPATGVRDAKLAGFDQLMTSFLALHEVPGASLAVTKNGRLVYARGFGYADIEKKEPVQPTSLFRIGSTSKPITAVAVLQLVERGKLKLDDKAFEIVTYKPHLEQGAQFDVRLDDVTIKHLLQHTAGWDKEKTFDPVFMSVDIAKALDVPPPAQPEHIIRYMLGKPLDFKPGWRHAYSNFGYCVLGRVIEKLAKQPYEAFIRKEVLEPLGIKNMRLGKSLLDGRAPGEVKYYEHGGVGPAVMGPNIGQEVPLPYGTFFLEGLEGSGAWIASAVDLARFATAFDDAEQCKLLKADSIKTMFARPDGLAGHDENGNPKEEVYGCGWYVRIAPGTGAATISHDGSLDGTASLLYRRPDGVSFVVLFNSQHGGTGQYLAEAVDPFLHRAVDRVQNWPDGDLFQKYR